MTRIQKDFKNSLIIMSIFILTMLVILNIFPTSSAQDNGMSRLQPNMSSNGELLFDVKISELDFSDTEPIEDDEVTIFITVVNNGTFPVTNLTVIFSIDNKELGRQNGISLEVNGSKLVEYNWTAEKWAHSIGAILSIDETPIKESMVVGELTVEAKPMGDISYLILMLASIFIIILLITLAPSLYAAVTSGSKSTKLDFNQ